MISAKLKCGLFGFLVIQLFWSPAARAQRNFSLSLAVTNGNSAVLRWPVQSATPVGDVVLVPKFQVERSSDLKSWTPIGDVFEGSLGQVLTVTDPGGDAAFYRVESLLDLEYAQLEHANLSRGELTLAILQTSRLSLLSICSKKVGKGGQPILRL